MSHVEQVALFSDENIRCRQQQSSSHCANNIDGDFHPTQALLTLNRHESVRQAVPCFQSQNEKDRTPSGGADYLVEEIVICPEEKHGEKQENDHGSQSHPPGKPSCKQIERPPQSCCHRDQINEKSDGK